MKKERKAVLKDSKYYYKKATGLQTVLRVFLPGTLMLISLTCLYASQAAETGKEHAKLMDSSGYNEYIQQQKDEIDDRYENGEFSENVYNAYMQDVEKITFQGYLKEKNDSYTLAKLEEFEKTRMNQAKIYMGTTAGVMVALGGIEIVRSAVVFKKAKKLEKEENKFRIYSYENGPEPEI